MTGLDHYWSGCAHYVRKLYDTECRAMRKEWRQCTVVVRDLRSTTERKIFILKNVTTIFTVFIGLS